VTLPLGKVCTSLATSNVLRREPVPLPHVEGKLQAVGSYAAYAGYPSRFTNG